ncbi:MAG: HAD-IC family P-type ATPase, partial [Clostridiales bacterium]|nr:HAD-IC family P-type ATPase [Clostridiales bacterium]
ETFSNHPVARSVRGAYSGEVRRDAIREYAEIPGQGVRAVIDGDTVLAGSGSLLRGEGVAFEESPTAGTTVYIAVNRRYAGCLTVSDEVKEDAKAAIAGLKAVGVKRTVMLTGDDAAVANAVAETLGIDECHARLFPADKVSILERLEGQARRKAKLAFVGDGINDAPVLARADVGVAMGGIGSDAAIEAADVVLMTDEPSKLIDAVRIAKRTKKIVWQNIIFALGAKSVFLILGAFGAASMWEAVFADVGVTLLAVLNAARSVRTDLFDKPKHGGESGIFSA